MLRRSHILTTAALLAVCATPASAVTFEDRSSDGAVISDVAPPPSSIAASAADEYQDLRSPDARDAARDLPRVQSPTSVVEVQSGGFDWGDAGIGAAGVFALFGIAGGSALFLTRRRRSVQVATH
jgi:hypothetical protein